MANIQLDTPVQYVKGVGPTRAIQLAQLGIQTVEDLLSYYPRRFDLRPQVQPIASLSGNEDPATVAGEVADVEVQRFGKRPFFRATISDGQQFVDLKWFHGLYLADTIKPGLTLAASGKVSVYRETLQLINPTFQIIDDPAGTNLDADELIPVYPAGAKLTSKVIAKIIHAVLPQARHLIQPWFGRDWLGPRGLPTRPVAVEAMHHPEDRDQWKQARRRLAYDECLILQLGVALMRMREVSRPAHALPLTDEIDRRIRARFPFPLTDAQSTAAGQIAADMGTPRPLNRLLQGDVGAGKTVVALYAALLAVAHRKQVAIMAPTAILAAQHFRKIREYLDGSKVRVEILTGSTAQPQRARVLDGLAEGSIHLVVGTHALLTETVRFRELALVVVDEQHKFGVRQRTGIRGKGFAPHYLVMTATPIPRTLAMTVFGDLDSSVIDELPPGRGTTTTYLKSPEEFDSILADVRRRVEAGQQAYFVYPLVSASAQSELTAAEDARRDLADGAFGGLRVDIIHGQMSADAKARAIGEFAAGRTQVLVASVVVEVGLDVPDANIMVICHAERFGLAQLHQLRGRIGRGSEDATCYLVAQPANPLARRRMEVLTETADGFRIAEEDLRIRGPGEVFGTRQHGLPDLKVANLAEDFELLRLARRDAFAIVADDPDLSAPEHQPLRREVIKAYAGKLNLLSGA